MDRITSILAPSTEGRDNAQLTVGTSPTDAPGAIVITRRGETAGELALPEITVTKPFSVIWRQADEVIQEAGYNRAAGTWLLNAGGSGVCTSGFVAQSTNGSNDLGVITAGHCQNTLRFYNVDSGENYYLDFRNETYGDGGDAQFMRSSRMMDAWFHVGPSTGRPVNNVVDSFVGQAVCRYGRTTNVEKCGVIQMINMNKTTSSGVVVKHLDYMNGGEVLPGDSGGSVYVGYEARGIIHGFAGGDSYFTRISAAQSATGTRVCRDPVCSW